MDNLTFNQRLLLALIPALATVGAAWLAVYFSIRKFYAEKLWEKRLEAYREILGLIVDFTYISWQISEALELATANNLSVAGTQKTAEHADALLEIDERLSKKAITGAFVVSAPVAESLMALRSKMNTIRKDFSLDLGNPERLIKFQQAIQEHLPSVRELINDEIHQKSILSRVCGRVRKAFEPFE